MSESHINELKKDRLGIVYISTSCIALFILFTYPVSNLAFETDLSDDNKGNAEATAESERRIVETAENQDEYKRALILEEFKKSVLEIKQMLDHESHWFELKFYFIGALVLGIFGLGIYESSKENSVFALLKNPLTLLSLTIACIVSTSIDIHIRSNRVLIAQHGIWIQNYVEPYLLKNNFSSFSSSYYTNEFLGWEQFLRLKHYIKDRDGEKVFVIDEKVYSRHSDNIYSLTYWPNVHYTTILLYGCFLCLLWWLRSQDDQTGPPYQLTTQLNNKNNLLLTRQFSFTLIQISFFVTAISSHYNPNAFKTRIALGNISEGFSTLIIYGGAFLILVLSGLMVLNHSTKQLRTDAEHLTGEIKNRSKDHGA